MKCRNQVNFVMISTSNQMDPLTTSGVCGEGGAIAASPPTLPSTREQRGAPGARGPTGLGWTLWTGEPRKSGTSGAPPKPPR